MIQVDRFDPQFRARHLGASQVPAAIGASPYERPITLWEKFKGLRAWDSFEDGDERAAVDVGHALEDGIAQLAARRLGVEVERAPMQTHPRMTWLVSSRDRIIPSQRNAPLECKSTAIVRPLWREARDRWGLDHEGGEGIPIYVAAQLQTQIIVARANADEDPPDHGYVAALIGGEGLRVYHVPYVEEIARAIVSQAARFWQHVVDPALGPPPPDGSEAFNDYLKERLNAITHPRQQRWLEGDAVDDLVTQAIEAHAAAKESKERWDRIKQEVLVLCGDGDGIKGPNGSVHIGYRNGKESLSQGRLREKLADLFREGAGEDAQRAAIDRAHAFIQACMTTGDPFTVITPRSPPKGKKK